MDENKNKISESTSETFDTWTLVTENSSSSSSSNNLNDNDIKRIEILNKDDDNITKTPEVNIEELSDGISVISESESIEECNERFPSLHENLFTTRSVEPCIQETITSLNRRENVDKKVLASTDASNKQTEVANCFCVKNIVSGIFYIGAIAGILGFIGQLKGINSGVSTAEINLMEERIGNLELQNNLLRAEINILEKKMNYLTSQQQQQPNLNQHHKNYNKYQDQHQQTAQHNDPKFNDKSDNNYHKNKYDVNTNLKPDITSGCESNEKYKDGLCIVIEDDHHKSTKQNEKKENGPKTFEDKNQQSNFNKDMKPNNNQHQHHQNENVYHKYKKESNDKHYKSNDFKSSEKNVDDFSAESDEDDDDDDDDNDSNHDFHKKHKYEKHDKKDDYYKKPKKYDEHIKDNRYNSKEYNKYDKSKEYNNKKKYENDWHNKLMDSRENYRKHNSKEKEGNWFVERGHGREEFRIFEDDEYKKKVRGH